MLRTIALAGLLAVPTTLTAQVPVPRQDASTRNGHLAMQGLLTSPSVSETSLASPSVELTAASGDKEAVARIGVTADDENFALTLKTPLQDLPKRSVPLSLEGLTSGSSAAFTYNRILWRYRADHQTTQAACRKYSFTHSENCTASIDVPSDKQDAFMMEVGYTRPWVFGLSGRIGRQTFDWVDRNSLESSSVEHNSTGGAAWLGTFLPQGFLVAKYNLPERLPWPPEHDALSAHRDRGGDILRRDRSSGAHKGARVHRDRGAAPPHHGQPRDDRHRQEEPGHRRVVLGGAVLLPEGQEHRPFGRCKHRQAV